MYVGTFKRYLIYNKGGNKNNCRYFLDDYSPSHNVVVGIYFEYLKYFERCNLKQKSTS